MMPCTSIDAGEVFDIALLRWESGRIEIAGHFSQPTEAEREYGSLRPSETVLNS
jgi:hypothetical protein